MRTIEEDIAIVGKIPAVPAILDVLCRTTGMRFAAVARVTEDRWIACSVLDKIEFGLKPGGELKVKTTLCDTVRMVNEPIVIDHVAEDEQYSTHPTPELYGFQSYISVPIYLKGMKFFGTLCAIDPRPAKLKNPETLVLFKLFAELISFHIDASENAKHNEANLLAERQISEFREQFIGVMGHDLRTPLSAISMATASLQMDITDEERSELFAIMERSIAKMSDLISNTLDFTRGRLGGGIPLERHSTEPLHEVLHENITEIRTVWPKRTIDVFFDFRETVRYDRQRMSQLFSNLLSNALIHGKRDTNVMVTGKSGEGRLEIAVTNAADLIPQETLERMFEPFSRGDSKDYREGLGLGLFIASEIAKSHGGSLEVFSDEGKTRFVFSMPVD